MFFIWFAVILFPLLEKPGPPAIVDVKPVTATSIYLSWREPNGARYNHPIFSIFYHPLSNQQLSKNENSSKTQFNISDLNPATSYVIHVIALNKYFKGDPSNQVIYKTAYSGMVMIYWFL